MDPRYSNYPRAGVGPGGSAVGQRPPGAHFDFISESFNIIRNDLGTWIAVSLLTILVTYAISLPLALGGSFLAYGSPLGAGATSPPSLNVLGIVTQIITNALTYALTLLFLVGQGMMGLQAARGQRPQIGEIFAPFRLFLPVFLTCVAVAVLVFLGFVLCIVPGILAMGLLILAPFAAYEQRLAPGDAIRWSLENSHPHMWGIFGLAFVASLVSGLGICLCGVGYLVTAPVFGIVLGLTYGTFRAPVSAPFVAYPPSGPIPPPAPGL